MKNVNLKNWMILALAAAGICLCLMLFAFNSHGSTKEGIAYLEQQSQLDISQLQTQINEQKKDERVSAIESGEQDVFAFFANSVLLGDSRVKDFSGYNYLPESQVLAELGYTAVRIDEYLDQIAAIQPEYIFVSYGVNDIESSIGSSYGENGYKQFYTEQLQKVQAASPNSKILVNTIMPVTDYADNSANIMAVIDDYNRQIIEMCLENGWTLINTLDWNTEALSDFYEPDGIHFTASFVPVWAWRMMETAAGLR